MADYSIHLTDTAAANAGLEQKVREEISQLLEYGLAAPLDLIFHSFDYEGAEFICYPRDGKMEVDTCYREDAGVKVGAGQFKGMSISLPRGDSGDDPLDH